MIWYLLFNKQLTFKTFKVLSFSLENYFMTCITMYLHQWCQWRIWMYSKCIISEQFTWCFGFQPGLNIEEALLNYVAALYDGVDNPKSAVGQSLVSRQQIYWYKRWENLTF